MPDTKPSMVALCEAANLAIVAASDAHDCAALDEILHMLKGLARGAELRIDALNERDVRSVALAAESLGSAMTRAMRIDRTKG